MLLKNNNPGLVRSMFWDKTGKDCIDFFILILKGKPDNPFQFQKLRKKRQRFIFPLISRKALSLANMVPPLPLLSLRKAKIHALANPDCFISTFFLEAFHGGPAERKFLEDTFCPGLSVLSKFSFLISLRPRNF